MNLRTALAAVAAFSFSAGLAAQTAPPAAATLPPAPGAAATQPAGKPAELRFPPVRPEFFTASAPSVETVNAFLKQIWGFDENRVWQVAAILATRAPGVAKVVVFIGDKAHPDHTNQTVFFTTPDGLHAIADNVIDFGPTPFAATRKVLQERADGPARGTAAKDLLLVEFSDLQCPHCRDAQPTMDQLAADFPQARIVFENFPLTEVHPFAMQAAAEGVCIRKARGDDAFVKYMQSVFDNQESLTADGVAHTLSTAAAKAGADPAAAAACAATPATTAAVQASLQLGKDVGVDQTPTLFVNGFQVPLGGVPYEVLKKIIVYRANQDGLSLTLQPSLKSLK